MDVMMDMVSMVYVVQESRFCRKLPPSAITHFMTS